MTDEAAMAGNAPRNDPQPTPQRAGGVSHKPGRPRKLPRASLGDTLRVVSTIVLPLMARGLIVRRSAMVRGAERMNADAKAVQLLQDLRRTYGRGPLRLHIPGRRMAIVLSPEHVHRVLEESPDPFTPAVREKRSALSHFEPHGVLISSNEDRPDRRRFNEETLDESSSVHRGANAMMDAINEEIDALVAGAGATGTLVWDDYSRTFMRMARRVTLGNSAADDEQITDDLLALRATANWAFLHPKRRALRERFLRRVQHYLDRAEPGSLAEWAARAHRTANTYPEHQVPQWLFAFDAANWASYRALALLASHPERRTTAVQEIAGRDLRTPQNLPFLRATVLESLRLWPTTPAVLRESLRRTQWEDGPMPGNTNILIYAPFFHRDDEYVEAAHRFEPEHWAHERTSKDWPFIPFSAGPAICPGRNLVLHTTSALLGRLLQEWELTLTDDRLNPSLPLPGTLDMFTLRFAVRAREGTKRPVSKEKD